MADASSIITGIAGAQFERARAKLTALVGQFFTYRDRLLQLRDRSDYLQRKADRTSNSALATATKQLAPQLDAAYNAQVDLEGRVQTALSQVTAIQQGGAGVSFASLASAASSILGTAAAIALHERKVDALSGLLSQLENKTLSSSEIAQLRSGGGMFAAGSAVLLGGAAVVLFLLFRPKRR